MSSTASTSSEEEVIQFQKYDVLRSGTARYLLLEFKGEGCFGQVAKCFNLQTEEMVAIKIHKHNNNKSIQNEVEMLRQLRALDTDKKNIVKFIDNFEFHGTSCLAFEMLDKSLWDLMKQRKMVSLNLSQIRPIIHQLLVAFSALKDMGIMYTDLKPDNVMLVNHEDQPFKIKLIDFGLAIPAHQAEVGMVLQARAYRSPEVYFGLPLTEAVDMWGMGCMMGFFYFGLHLFPSDCDYHWVKAILHMLGQPEHYQLITGQNTWKFFKRENSGWRLRTPVEYEIVTGVRPKVSQRFFDMAQNLEDAVRRCPSKRDPIEYEDRMAFLSLLKQCLQVDAEQRISPREALKHTYVTMAHLGNRTSSYVDTAGILMAVSPLEDLDGSDDSFNPHYKDNTKSSTSEEYISYEDSFLSFISGEDDILAATSEDSPLSSFSGIDDTESTTGEDSSLQSFSSEDDLEPATTEESNADSSFAIFSSDDDIEPATTKNSSLPSFGGEDDVEPATTQEYDADSSLTILSSEDAKEPPTAEDYDADLSLTILSGGDNTETTISEDSLPSFGGDDIEPVTEDFDADSSTVCHNQSAVSSNVRVKNSVLTGSENKAVATPEISTGRSAATDFNNGVRDTATPTEEKSGNAASNDDNPNTGCFPIASNTSANVGPTDGAAASISSDIGAAAAITLPDADDVNTSPDGPRRRSIFRRTRKFFSRMRRRVVSIFTRQNNTNPDL